MLPLPLAAPNSSAGALAAIISEPNAFWAKEEHTGEKPGVGKYLQDPHSQMMPSDRTQHVASARYSPLRRQAHQ